MSHIKHIAHAAREVWVNMPAMMYAGETGIAVFPAATSSPNPGLDISTYQLDGAS
jgi:hypothetical protein